jgi:hypothetical protein
MGYKGPLGIVTPDEFRKRTSLTMSSRSGSTRAMDEAYDAYYTNRTPETGRLLYAWLTQYRTDHGNSWSKCDRNTVSGGLLEYLHNSLGPGAPSPSAALAMDQRAAARIRDIEIPSARFGVLYLLSNIKIEIDAMAAFVSGATAVGGVIGAGMTTDYSNLGSTDAVRNVMTVAGKGITAPQIASGGALAVKTIKKIADESPTARIARLQAAATAQVKAQLEAAAAGPAKAQAPAAPPPPPRPRPPVPLLRQSAFNHLPVTLEELQIAALKQVSQGNIAGLPTAFSVGTPALVIVQAGQALWDTLKLAFQALGDLLMKGWRLRYSVATVEMLAQALKKATTVAVDMIMKNAVPFLGGVIDVGTGLARTIGEACSRIASWSDRRHIHIRAGHPEEIAKAIEHQMVMGFCSGLVDILKGAGKMAVSMFLPGLGSLVTVAMAVIDWLIRFLSRLAEKISIDQFLEQARHHYEAEKQRSRKIDGVYQPNTEKGSIITDTKAFTAFFLEGCKASPLIAMVTLNSGLGGSLMTLVDVFDPNGAQSTKMVGNRKEFDIGNDYFTRLKRYSVTYMKKSGFKITHRKSGTVMTAGEKSMAGYLIHAQGLDPDRQSHVEAPTLGSQLVKMARA